MYGAEVLKGWLARFPDIQAVVEVLDKVGALEQVSAEAQQRVDAAAAAEVAAKRAQESAEADIASARASIAEMFRDARKQAEEFKERAVAKAAQIEGAAEAEADKILADAKREADKRVDDAKAGVDAANAQVAEARALAGDIQARIENGSHELATLEAKIARAKQSIAKILG